jgi:hypothetical protein
MTRSLHAIPSHTPLTYTQQEVKSIGLMKTVQILELLLVAVGSEGR